MSSPNECSNHSTDDLGWPLGNCPACRLARAAKSRYYDRLVCSGIADPDLAQPEKTESEEGL